MTQQILIVEDEIDLAMTIADVLRRAGYEPFMAHTAEDGLWLVSEHQPLLILLDVMIPNMGGWEFCKRAKAQTNIPIIFLTALGGVQDIIKGLDIGADDYLVKPFQEQELLARLRAHLRRIPDAFKQDILTFEGGLSIDLVQRRVLIDDRLIDLTSREFDLLAVLAKNAGKVVPFDDLLQQAWGIQSSNAKQHLKPFIHYLRRKIEEDLADPRWVLTVRGVGYRFTIE